jgi:hypothetical protein
MNKLTNARRLRDDHRFQQEGRSIHDPERKKNLFNRPLSMGTQVAIWSIVGSAIFVPLTERGVTELRDAAIKHVASPLITSVTGKVENGIHSIRSTWQAFGEVAVMRKELGSKLRQYDMLQAQINERKMTNGENVNLAHYNISGDAAWTTIPSTKKDLQKALDTIEEMTRAGEKEFSAVCERCRVQAADQQANSGGIAAGLVQAVESDTWQDYMAGVMSDLAEANQDGPGAVGKVLADVAGSLHGMSVLADEARKQVKSHEAAAEEPSHTHGIARR